MKLLGRFFGQWQQDIHNVISTAKPFDWSGLRNFNKEIYPNAETAQYQDQYSIEHNEHSVLTNVEHSVPPTLQKIVDTVGLLDVHSRIHVQHTGQVWDWHKDTLTHINPTHPDQVLRVIVMLTDWVPGHFYQYNDVTYRDWKAGDIHTFDWATEFHCTANASQIVRVSMVMTGIVGTATQEFLNNASAASEYRI